jgi:acetyl-CoA synthetase
VSIAEKPERIETLLAESRLFAPAPGFTEKANASCGTIYDQAERDRLGFWEEMARRLDWFTPWTTTLDWQPPHAQWFIGGRLNAAYNCVDRHLAGWRRTKAALIWEGEPGDSRVMTYQDLHREVGQFANVLKGQGVRRGDRVTLYMPMIPELAIAMLACARIGAIHSVVFGGFSAEALRERINDSAAKLVVTADGGWRRGSVVPLKQNTDEAVAGCPTVEKVIVVRRVGHESLVARNWVQGRDLWYHTLMRGVPTACECEEMESEDPLYILYTSGSTGKPKGVLHTTGGYLTGAAATHHYVFDIKDSDVYWCTADIGWVTGHSYLVYGPLANGCTTVMYEGAPDYPDRGRFWDIIQKYRVSVFYTAPTAIRAFVKWGEEWPRKYDLSSLRLLGTVGEPINPEAWMWYHTNIGLGSCPIVDTYWQTETGSILITPLPGVTHAKPGSATVAFPGIVADVLDSSGRPVGPGEGGLLVIKEPWPSMLRTVWGDPDRYVQTYFSKFGPGIYFTSDGAKRDENGYFVIVGRIDDVISVSGHRIGTWEVESALVDHGAVAEAAVIGRADELKGQAIVAFVTLKEGHRPSSVMEQELKAHVVTKIGALARPQQVIFSADLPKTRSGKIMRRLLRDVAEGRALGDTTTLADPTIVQQLKQQYEEQE